MEKGHRHKIAGIIITIAAVLIIILICTSQSGKNRNSAVPATGTEMRSGSQLQENDGSSETPPDIAAANGTESDEVSGDDGLSAAANGSSQDSAQQAEVGNSADTPDASTSETAQTPNKPFDLFSCCKDFAIQNGELNGDHSTYQQPSSNYGGYEDEYFSVSYWGDSNMVEFCLHCPLDDTLSINFYLRMRNGYNGKYEYVTSKYFRSDGVPLRDAGGYIDPSVFSDRYPLNCDYYDGSADGQDSFMEESREGMCDLIKCLKTFTSVENIGCSFADFGFVNF